MADGTIEGITAGLVDVAAKKVLGTHVYAEAGPKPCFDPYDILEKHDVPVTLSEEQRAACDAAGLEMRPNPERIFATKLDVDKYIDGLLEQKGVLLNRGKTLDNHHYYEVMKKVEYKGLKFKPGDYISRDTLHHEIEWFRGKNMHRGAIEPITGELYKDPVKDRTLKIK